MFTHAYHASFMSEGLRLDTQQLCHVWPDLNLMKLIITVMIHKRACMTRISTPLYIWLAKPALGGKNTEDSMAADVTSQLQAPIDTISVIPYAES